jgi:alanine racemase
MSNPVGEAVLTRYDPWLELDGDAVRHNVGEISRLAEGRPMVAVVKNNGYGLGGINVARILDPLPQISALAVIKADEAFELLDAGVTKPILLMALAPPTAEQELAARGVRLCPFTEDSPERLRRIGRALGRPIQVQVEVDTGIGRMGVPAHRAVSLLERLADTGAVQIEGIFTTLTADDFEPEQLRRLGYVAEQARARQIAVGKLHAVSTHGLFFHRQALLDAVRVGLALYGAYPAGARQLDLADLRPAFRLQARVVRVEQLQPGDGVNYRRKYVADRPTWIATVPVGHVDGYARQAANGCAVEVNGHAYRVVGEVSASHTVLELGQAPSVAVGDTATLVGAGGPVVHPNEVALRAGISVYDVLMHLGANLPVVVRNR